MNTAPLQLGADSLAFARLAEARRARYGRAALKRARRHLSQARFGALTSREVAREWLHEAAWIFELAHGGALDVREAERVLREEHEKMLGNEPDELGPRLHWAREQGRQNPRTLDERKREFARPPESLSAPASASDAQARENSAIRNGNASAHVADDVEERKLARGPLPALPYRRVFDLARLRPENDIVSGLLGPRELALLWGDKSAGKTMVAVALCGSIATGEPFFECVVPHTGSVVYVCGEGLAGLRNRFEAWAHDLDEAKRRAVAERVFVVIVPPNLLGSDAELLVRTIAEIHEQAGPVRLVVLDTLASLTPGADENKQESGTSVIALARTIGEKTDGASVLAIHHAKKDGSEYRGSSTLGGGFDVILKSTKTGAGFELHVRKQKDREVPPDGWAFTAEVVTLDPGTDPSGADTVRSVRVGAIVRADGKLDRDVGLESTLGRVADAQVAAGSPGADCMRRSLDLGIVLLLDAGPKRFGEIVAACKGLAGADKAARSKIGRTLVRMTKAEHLAASGAERGRTYSLAEPGRKAFSGALDALKNLPAEACPW